MYICMLLFHKGTRYFFPLGSICKAAPTKYIQYKVPYFIFLKWYVTSSNLETGVYVKYPTPSRIYPGTSRVGHHIRGNHTLNMDPGNIGDDELRLETTGIPVISSNPF